MDQIQLFKFKFTPLNLKSLFIILRVLLYKLLSFNWFLEFLYIYFWHIFLVNANIVKIYHNNTYFCYIFHNILIIVQNLISKNNRMICLIDLSLLSTFLSFLFCFIIMFRIVIVILLFCSLISSSFFFYTKDFFIQKYSLFCYFIFFLFFWDFINLFLICFLNLNIWI